VNFNWKEKTNRKSIKKSGRYRREYSVRNVEYESFRLFEHKMSEYTPMDLDPFPPLGTKPPRVTGNPIKLYWIIWLETVTIILRYAWYANIRGIKGYIHYRE